ncbi:MAG: hypothetical protein N2317_07045 [Syntrophales bacterium]|nr:hypothetical protein [Syntrophales bacterium]
MNTLLFVGILLIVVGYGLLFYVPLNSSADRIFAQAIVGMVLSIGGAFLIALYIYRKR